ncbi:MAG: anti-phage dCTP deaminase [Candidatus Nitrosopumilus sp. bin_68KS]
MTKREEQQKDQELFFGIISPVGALKTKVTNSLETKLINSNYQIKNVKISELLKSIDGLPINVIETNTSLRINSLMDRGNKIREKLENGSALAQAAIWKIRGIRESVVNQETPIPRTAYIIDSLKHPDEVELLRKTYGKSFWAISVYTPYQERKNELVESLKNTHYDENYENAAVDLLDRDQEESGDYGQNIRKTFPLGDVFVDTDPHKLDSSMERILKLIFGYQYSSPTIDEYGMFLAQASAFMSASLSRQVGASILTQRGEIISTGTNEVPNQDGGVCGEFFCDDKREHAKGKDYNTQRRNFILGEFLKILKTEEWLSPNKPEDANQLLKEALDNKEIKNSELMDLTEFGRETHAEMTALLEAARKSIGVKNCHLYCTTFPCHNCAKHIITAGLKKVFYIEPYPKSMAEEMFGDFIVIDGADSEKIEFNPFVGISPRRFMDVFQWRKRKNDDGTKLPWAQSNSNPRFSDDPTAIIRKESNEVYWLDKDMRSAGLKWCPS